MAIFTPDTNNEMFQLAIQLVNQSNRNIFLTGKAGTGKTTFLKYIRENCPKQMAVVAPTGVAAINAGGVTIHSFFQLPLAPYIPEAKGTGFPAHDQDTSTGSVSNKHSLLSRLRFNSDKKKVIQQLEILVIDEISMVRCDVLDAIDTVLRHIRQLPSERFGGVQFIHRRYVTITTGGEGTGMEFAVRLLQGPIFLRQQSIRRRTAAIYRVQ